MNKNIKISNEFNPFRLSALMAFFALGISVIIDTIRGIHNPYTIVPYVHIVTYVVNFSLMLMCILIIIFPRRKKLIIIPIFAESIFTVLIGYEFLGIILYAFTLIMLFAWDFFIHRFKRKILFAIILWILILLSLIPFGIDRFFFAVGVSLFNLSIYFCIYSLLFSKLSHLIPEIRILQDKDVKPIPKPGSLLVFQDYPFTERQIMCIYLVMQGTSSYKSIADRLAISISVIKKEMLEIYHFFGVKNREMLYILLSQYNPVYPEYVEKLKD
ncbi:MAG TPA: hypothetical protein PLG87_04315 [Treponemataceae bacterium]|nr:hypothetical protein [Treponemataceae bacterium]